jgi:hypothetical protein
MADFTGFYLVCYLIDSGKRMIVKFGDTRGEADLKKRYHGFYYLKPTRVHGNSLQTGIGKKIQNAKMDRLVNLGLALQKDATEEYIVDRALGESIIYNFDENTPDGFTSTCQIKLIKNQQF